MRRRSGERYEKNKIITYENVLNIDNLVKNYLFSEGIYPTDEDYSIIFSILSYIKLVEEIE